MLMETGRESLCCKEIDKVSQRSGDLDCITEHDGFSSLCLNPHVLEAAIYQYVNEDQGGYVDDTPAFE